MVIVIPLPHFPLGLRSTKTFQEPQYIRALQYILNVRQHTSPMQVNGV